MKFTPEVTDHLYINDITFHLMIFEHNQHTYPEVVYKQSGAHEYSK